MLKIAKLFFISILVSTSFNINAAIDEDAQIVNLRKNCLEDGAEVPNCFISSSAVMDWIQNIRTVTKPLTINVGPGKHDYFKCVNTNKLSIKGSGPTQSFFSGLHASNCFDLNVQDVTVTNWFPSPIYWSGDGSSIWTNVQVIGSIYAWTETGCDQITKRPLHKWFASQLKSNSKTVYLSACSENWIFGSELVLTGADLNGVKNGVMVGAANGENTNPELHLYGGNLRVILQDDITYSDMTAVYAGRNGEVHIHGTGIDVVGNNINNNVTALRGEDGGMIHAAQSAFVMKTEGDGKIIRINNVDGISKIMAPYLWEKEILSKGNNFISDDGADRTTEIVCDTQSCSPHSYIYMSSCTTNGPWFDIATNSCR